MAHSVKWIAPIGLLVLAGPSACGGTKGNANGGPTPGSGFTVDAGGGGNGGGSFGDGATPDGTNCAPTSPDQTGCSCQAGQTRPCYSGPPSTRNVSPCHDGSQSCVAVGEFEQFGPCTGETLPSATAECTPADAAPAPPPPDAGPPPPPIEAGPPPPIDAGPPPPIDASMPVDACSPPTGWPFQGGQDWTGTYTCPQGLTIVDLEIVDVQCNGTIDAVYNFNFDGTIGAYWLSGTYDPSTFEANFTPVSWINQPGSNWYMVGMDGVVNTSASPMSYTGQISGAGCGSFEVTQ